MEYGNLLLNFIFLCHYICNHSKFVLFVSISTEHIEKTRQGHRDERRRIRKKNKTKLVRIERNAAELVDGGGDGDLLVVEARGRQNWSWKVRGRRVASGGE